MINCMSAPLRRRGIEKLFELCMEAETERDLNENIYVMGPHFLTSLMADLGENQVSLNGGPVYFTNFRCYMSC